MLASIMMRSMIAKRRKKRKMRLPYRLSLAKQLGAKDCRLSIAKQLSVKDCRLSSEAAQRERLARAQLEEQ